MFPVLLHIGSFDLHTYGVILMIAFAAALWRTYAVARARNLGVSPEDAVDAGIWIMVAGLIGARLLFVALEWNEYRSYPWNIMKLWEGGVSFHGGLFGGLIALLVFCRVRRVPVLKLMDIMGPSAMLGYAIGRIGCFFNGCCYGVPTTMPWGVRFNEGNFFTPPSHPTQLYSSILSFLFLAALVSLERRKAFDGQVFCWYIVCAAVERFIMEIWRAGVTSTVVAFGLTDVQFLCMAMLIAAVVSLNVLRRTQQRRANSDTVLGAAKS